MTRPHGADNMTIVEAAIKDAEVARFAYGEHKGYSVIIKLVYVRGDEKPFQIVARVEKDKNSNVLERKFIDLKTAEIVFKNICEEHDLEVE